MRLDLLICLALIAYALKRRRDRGQPALPPLPFAPRRPPFGTFELPSSRGAVDAADRSRPHLARYFLSLRGRLRVGGNLGGGLGRLGGNTGRGFISRGHCALEGGIGHLGRCLGGSGHLRRRRGQRLAGVVPSDAIEPTRDLFRGVDLSNTTGTTEGLDIGLALVGGLREPRLGGLLLLLSRVLERTRSSHPSAAAPTPIGG
jgi:hypothetical protein